MKQISKDHECPVCLSLFLNPVILPKCKHVFCFRCLKDQSDHRRVNSKCPCPLCRKSFTLNELIVAQQLRKAIQLLHPQQLQLKKQEILIEKTVRLIIGHQFKKQPIFNAISEGTPKKQIISWKFFIRGLPSSRNPSQSRNPFKDIQKVELRLHPSFENNTIVINADTQENPVYQLQIERRSQTFNFRVFIDIIWKQHCGGGKSLIHYDLDDKVSSESSKNQKLVEIYMKLRPS